MQYYGAIVKMQAKLYERGEIEQGAIVKRVYRHFVFFAMQRTII